jgi:hypothetical protein
MDYMGAIIWQKQTTMNTTGGGAVMGSFPYPRNGILKIDYEFILVFKKQGKAPVPTAEQKQGSIMTKEEWNKYFASHWTFGGAKQDGHIAVFPEELPHRLIKMFSFVGETVFDPFMGSGTTALAARNLQRNSIGYEINPEFKVYYEQKVESTGLFSDSQCIYKTDNQQFSISDKIASLPYIFHDPHKLENKVNLKQLQFGSRIDKTKKEREEYFSVKEIITPNTLRLNTGQIIKLLGVKVDDQVADSAITYLQNTTKGHKVYMRFDNIKYDTDNNMVCYLYLDNKTFINAHLIKRKLATADTNTEYKYKSKFISY